MNEWYYNQDICPCKTHDSQFSGGGVGGGISHTLHQFYKMNPDSQPLRIYVADINGLYFKSDFFGYVLLLLIVALLFFF